MPINNNSTPTRPVAPRTDQNQVNQAETQATQATDAAQATQATTDAAAPAELKAPPAGDPSLTGADQATSVQSGHQVANDPRLGGTSQMDAMSSLPGAGGFDSNPSTRGISIDIPEVVRVQDGLNLDAINTEFNPLKAMIGEFQDPGEMFQSKVAWPMQKASVGLMQAIGGLPDAPQFAALKGLVGSLKTIDALPPKLQAVTTAATDIQRNPDLSPEQVQTQLTAVLEGTGLFGEEQIAPTLAAITADPNVDAGVALEQVIKSSGALPAVPLFIAAMGENTVTRGTAQQFRLDDGSIGNNVTLYGNNGAMTVDHSGIDAVTKELGEGMRFLKVMSHIDRAGQGGAMDAIIGDGVGGVTHTGGFALGYKDGQSVSIASDWPSDYGTMDNGNKKYNAILMGVDYQVGTKGELSDADLKAYKENGDMWDVFAAVIPFAGSDLDPRFTNYKYNPLEAHDHDSTVALGMTLASVDKDKVLQEHGAFYCAEGQYTINSMAPKGELLLKESKFGDTRAGEMIRTFQKLADEIQQASTEPDFDVRKHPNLVWEKMAEVGVEAGGINEKTYNHLANTKRTSAWLEFVPETQQGWEKADPINEEGMIAKPMTIATMAWGLIRSYMPIDKMGASVAAEMERLYNLEVPAGAPPAQQAQAAAVKSEIGKFLGDQNETFGQINAQKFGQGVANALLLNVLSQPEFKQTLLDKSGFKEITNDADKAKYEGLYDEFVGAVKGLAVKGAGQKERDAVILAMDDKFRNLSVTREVRVNMGGKPELDPATGEQAVVDGELQWEVEPNEDNSYVAEQTGPMLYAAPYNNILFAQEAELHQSSIRYITNLQHVDQATAPGTDNFSPAMQALCDEATAIHRNADLSPGQVREQLTALLEGSSLDLSERQITGALESMLSEDSVNAGTQLETLIRAQN